MWDSGKYCERVWNATSNRATGTGKTAIAFQLADKKLPDLIELKYHAVADAVSVLGSVADIRATFIGFQKNLYEARAIA